MIKFRNLTADDVEVRIATVKKEGVSLLLYKDARVDQSILDETVGAERWQKRYEMIGGSLYCSVGIRVLHEDTQTYEWIWKQDVGVESYSDKEKGRASDAFKRACFCWGIGRELYTAPFIWLRSDQVKIVDTGNNVYKCRESFTVGDMAVEGGKITALSILNARGEVVYTYGTSSHRTAQTASQTVSRVTEPVQAASQAVVSPQEPKPMLLDAEQRKMLYAELARTGVTEQQICSHYRLTSIDDMTIGVYTKCMKKLKISATRKEMA